MKASGLVCSRRSATRLPVSSRMVEPLHGDARARWQADEGIAAEALAALHRFEQVGIGPVGELEVDRQRRVEVGEGFEVTRDAVVALRRPAG